MHEDIHPYVQKYRNCEPLENHIDFIHKPTIRTEMARDIFIIKTYFRILFHFYFLLSTFAALKEMLTWPAIYRIIRANCIRTTACWPSKSNSIFDLISINGQFNVRIKNESL